MTAEVAGAVPGAVPGMPAVAATGFGAAPAAPTGFSAAPTGFSGAPSGEKPIWIFSVKLG